MNDNEQEREYEVDKTVDFYIRLDYKKEQVRAVKTKTKSKPVGKNEFIIPASVNVRIPEVNVPEISATIDVPPTRVKSAILESLHDEDFPEWRHTADQVLDDNLELVQNEELMRDDRVDLLTSRVMNSLDEFAPFDQVHEYVDELVREINTGELDWDSTE